MKNMSGFYKVSGIVIAVILAGVALFSAQKQQSAPKKKLQVTIQPRHMADAIYTIVHGHREVYVKMHAEKSDQLPDPCSVFRRNAEAVASRGVEFSYVLRSLKPVAERNLPETEFERRALESLLRSSDEPVCGEELLGGRWYFTAVYPEKAIHSSCADCHNKISKDQSVRYKQGDVMGAIIVRVALEL
jgi:hypothetical protein